MSASDRDLPQPTGVTVAVGDSADRSLAFATHLAERWSVPLATVHVDAPSDTDAPAGTIATDIADRLSGGEVLVVESSNADPWRSRHSVAEHLIDAFDGTAIGLGPHADRAPGAGPIVVGLDGSAGAEQALPMAEALAALLEEPLLLARVVADDLHDDEQAEIEAATAYLDRVGAEVGTDADVVVAVSNDPVQALVGVAAERTAAMVVVASRGDRQHARASMSRTAAGLIGRAPCPVMVTPS